MDTVIKGITEARVPYVKGDFIVCGSREGHYPMKRADFTMRYETTRTEPAVDTTLASEGFRLYTPKGKVWAREVTAAECGTHFPAGHFLGRWGESARIEPLDFLAMPYPSGGEIYSIRRNLFLSTYKMEGKNQLPSPLAPHDRTSSNDTAASSQATTAPELPLYNATEAGTGGSENGTTQTDESLLHRIRRPRNSAVIYEGRGVLSRWSLCCC